MLDDQTNSEDTPSVPNVMWALYLDHEGTSALVKCNECKTPTEHEIYNAQPMPTGISDINPAEAMKKSRRMQMCTYCGTMSLRV